MAGVDAFSGARSTTNSTDQSITGSQADVRIDDVIATTEDATNAVLPGTAAHDEAESIETAETKNDQQATDPVITAQINAISAKKDTA